MHSLYLSDDLIDYSEVKYIHVYIMGINFIYLVCVESIKYYYSHLILNDSPCSAFQNEKASSRTHMAVGRCLL